MTILGNYKRNFQREVLFSFDRMDYKVLRKAQLEYHWGMVDWYGMVEWLIRNAESGEARNVSKNLGV